MDEKFYDAKTESELSSTNINVPNNILEMFNKINEKNVFMVYAAKV